MQLADFTPIPALIGGVLIGLSASIYLLVNGRVAGISGMLTGLISREPDWGRARISFLFGLVAVGMVTELLVPGAIGASPRGLGTLALAGLLVGFGTRLARGCTSGHGICGISRGSLGSIGATATFVGTGMATATLFHLFAGQP